MKRFWVNQEEMNLEIGNGLHLAILWLDIALKAMLQHQLGIKESWKIKVSVSCWGIECQWMTLQGFKCLHYTIVSQVAQFQSICSWVGRVLVLKAIGRKFEPSWVHFVWPREIKGSNSIMESNGFPILTLLWLLSVTNKSRFTVREFLLSFMRLLSC